MVGSPLVSVIIVNYNGINFVESCLKSVLNTEYSNFEVIFIDNASIDKSPTIIKEKFGFDQRVKIIENKQNLGPVKGRNIGIANSKGEYIAFLDNDTEVDKNWLKEFVSVLGADIAIGAAQSKLLLFDRKTIDSCGHYLSISGFPYEIGVGEWDMGQYDRLFNIFGARSAAMIIRKDVLDIAGYFDEDYFIYSEETDLSWRIWLNNYRIVYVPKSIVYHKKGGSLNICSRRLIFYEGAKNCTKTLIKNLGFKKLLLILPLHIGAWIMMSIIFILEGRTRDAKAIISGLCWDLKNIKHILKGRKDIQVNRLISDKKLMPIIMGNHNFLVLFKKGLRWIGRI